MGALLGAACTAALPRHEVLPWPEHISAGIAAGDRVEILRRNGETSVVRVVSIGNDVLVTEDDGEIPFADLDALYRIGLSPPRNPCDTGAPLACSAPAIVTLLSDFHAEYRDRFRAACANHDLCYRHGASTYGFARESCDLRFRKRMRNICVQTLALDLVERLRCEAAAAQFHDAVRRFGEDRYLAQGPVCEFLGPPDTVADF
ncbi:MAG: hypothetical protein R3315_09095 [Woeseiaceae bacterium]|nr:hypothetical protein [Woeseiaceae bacterium]